MRVRIAGDHTVINIFSFSLVFFNLDFDVFHTWLYRVRVVICSTINTCEIYRYYYIVISSSLS